MRYSFDEFRQHAARWTLLVGLSTTIGCSAADDAGGSDAPGAGLGTARDELAMNPLDWWKRFPGVVNSCFWNDGLSPIAYARAKLKARVAVERTWGSAARLRFTGWNDCAALPFVPGDGVPIILRQTSHEGGGYAVPGNGSRLGDETIAGQNGSPPREVPAQVVIRIPLDDVDEMPHVESVAVHEMGHVIGIEHEHQRSDVIRCEAERHTTTPCSSDNQCPAEHACDLNAGSGVPGEPGLCIHWDRAPYATLLLATPYDPTSIMNYCRPDLGPRLSFWDIYGIGRLYAPRTNAFRQLVSAFNGTTIDSATFATTQTTDELVGPVYAPSNVYKLDRGEGWILGISAPGAVALQLYKQNHRNAYALIRAGSSNLSKLQSQNYVLHRTEGYVYPSQQPGTVPLKLLYHAYLNDWLTTSDAALAENLIAFGFEDHGIEGYIFEGTTDQGQIGAFPYEVLWGLSKANPKDYALIHQTSARAPLLLAAGYERAGYDSVVFRSQVPGTVPFKQFYHSARGDHFATATEIGAASALLSGYEPLTHEQLGFVFAHSTSQPAPWGTSPVNAYTNGQDNYTTLDRVTYMGAGYAWVRTEGHAFSSNW